MNSYERTQAAIDYIENHLTAPIQLEKVAQAACFSLPHFYRIFHALVGHSVKEYIRKRRLSEAASRIASTSESLIQIAFDYQFNTQESFTRAFRSMFGITPGRFRKSTHTDEVFPPVNVIVTYVASDDINSLDPRIKVLKELKPCRVASYRAFSEKPEISVWQFLMSWADKNSLLRESSGYRIFGFDNPGPQKRKTRYGYEFCMTVDESVKPSAGITVKTLPGGLYAVTHTTVGTIEAAWNHFVKWLAISKYRHAKHQCLEEHLIVTEVPGCETPIDLYLPIRKPQDKKGAST